MRLWHRIAIRSLRTVDWLFRQMRRGNRWLRGKSKSQPIAIDGYFGYARPDYIFLKGRILQDKQIRASETDSKWRNFVNTFKRFASDEVPHALVEIEVGANQFLIRASEEGYFTLDEPLEQALSKNGVPYTQAKVSVLEAKRMAPPPPTEQVPILLPDATTPYAVISDIDDTILHSYITSPMKWKAFYATFFHNAATRKQVKGAADYFRQLVERTQKEIPFFYVSNSPWNLYDLLIGFLKNNDFPLGPILLREIKSSTRRLSSETSGHKYRSIVKLMETYPYLPFVLIGDSGEKDALIYREIDERYPGRILAIVIREVPRRRSTKQRAAQVFLENHPATLWLKEFDQNGNHLWEILEQRLQKRSK